MFTSTPVLVCQSVCCSAGLVFLIVQLWRVAQLGRRLLLGNERYRIRFNIRYHFLREVLCAAWIISELGTGEKMAAQPGTYSHASKTTEQM